MSRFAVGEIVLRTHYAEDGKVSGIEILRADEYALISIPLIEQIRSAPAPGVILDQTIRPAVLTIHGTNREVAYEIGEPDPDHPHARQATRIELR